MPPRLLRNGNRRAQPGNLVDVRLGHLAEKLSCVAGEALDVSALTFGKQRIEGHRTLAGAAYASEANQLVPRQRKVHVEQIMLASPFYNDV